MHTHTHMHTLDELLLEARESACRPITACPQCLAQKTLKKDVQLDCSICPEICSLSQTHGLSQSMDLVSSSLSEMPTKALSPVSGAILCWHPSLHSICRPPLTTSSPTTSQHVRLLGMSKEVLCFSQTHTTTLPNCQTVPYTCFYTMKLHPSFKALISPPP